MSAQFHVAYAERECGATYGGEWSALARRKSLLKFGGNAAVGTVWQTLWSQGGDEVYATGNVIDKVSSSNAGDTGVINIEGHTISGTGADVKFTFVTQKVTLAGQAKVSLTTPLARVSRCFNATDTEWLGEITVYEDDTLTGGIPNTAAKIHAKVSAGDQQTRKAATTFADDTAFFISSWTLSINKKTAGTADCELQVRKPGGVFLPKARITVSSAGTSTFIEPFAPYLIVPPNSDVRVMAIADSNGVEASAHISGYIAGAGRQSTLPTR